MTAKQLDRRNQPQAQAFLDANGDRPDFNAMSFTYYMTIGYMQYQYVAAVSKGNTIGAENWADRLAFEGHKIW